jgi:alkylation response protein AidB-like acyl-CoA dehydrogenase
MGPSILAHGTEEQKSRYLPEILSGDATYCIGMSEPEAGSDLAGLRTRAIRSQGGWVIRGHKIWTSLAHLSTYIYLVARTDPGSERHQGLSEFIVPLTSEGVTIAPIHDMSGAHHFNEVFFEDVLVADDALIGEEGRGWYQITSQLGYERAGLERIMSVWPLLRAMRADAGEDPERMRELGEIEAAVLVARQLAYRVAFIVDSGSNPDHHAAMAKLFGNEVEQRMVEVASRWAGRESRLAPTSDLAPFGGHLFPAWLIAPSFSIRGGTTEILKGIVARRALGL